MLPAFLLRKETNILEFEKSVVGKNEFVLIIRHGASSSA